MIRKRGKKGKTRTGHLDPLWVPTQGIYSEWVRGRGRGRKGEGVGGGRVKKKREHFDLN